MVILFLLLYWLYTTFLIPCTAGAFPRLICKTWICKCDFNTPDQQMIILLLFTLLTVPLYTRAEMQFPHNPCKCDLILFISFTYFPCPVSNNTSEIWIALAEFLLKIRRGAKIYFPHTVCLIPPLQLYVKTFFTAKQILTNFTVNTRHKYR